jgi:thiol-disulfide isomerase/thioredoxin
LIEKVATLEELGEITNYTKRTVVKFWAEWCQPCKKLAPHFEAAADKSTATFVEIDIENCEKKILDAYRIQSVPVVLYFNMDRFEVTAIEGRTSLQILKEIGE